MGTTEREELLAEIERLRAENERLKAQIEDELIRRIAQLNALHRVNAAANSSLNLDEMLRLTVHTVSEVMRTDACSVYLFEPGDRLVLRATVGLNPEAVGKYSIRLGAGITGLAAAQGRPIAVKDAWGDPRFMVAPGLGEEPYNSMLSVPIILFAGSGTKLVGVLNLMTRQPREFTPDELNFLETVAGQLAIAIENARLYSYTDQKLQEKIAQLSTLQQVFHLMTSTLDIGQVLKVIVDQAVALTRCDAAAIFQLDPDSEFLTIVAAHGLPENLTRTWRARPGETAPGLVVRTGLPLVIPDTAELVGRRVVPLGDVTDFRAIFCVPLATHGQTFGALGIYCRDRHDFDPDEVMFLSTFADQAAVALTNARLYSEAQRNLAAKSAMLAEMHHRVKNNLQNVAALLSLQYRRSRTEEARRVLKESLSRIEAIAAVHDLLSEGQAECTTLQRVAHQIADVVLSHLVPPRLQVEFGVNGDEIRLPARVATVFALVLNELLNNAVDHGRPSEGPLRVKVTGQYSDDEVRVIVADNGPGFPPDFSVDRHGGLGLRIVRTLVEQDLGGRLRFGTNGGAVITITFPPQ
ncbi:MAG: histidine kinase [Chloroflexota bacterium]